MQRTRPVSVEAFNFTDFAEWHVNRVVGLNNCCLQKIRLNSQCVGL
jgi:hypothetical protein